MPAAAPVITAVAAGALAASGPGFIIGGVTFTGLAAGAIVAAGSLALSFVTTALTPKPNAISPSSAPSFNAPDLGGQQRDNLLTVRQALGGRSFLFGRSRLGGYLTFM